MASEPDSIVVEIPIAPRSRADTKGKAKAADVGGPSTAAAAAPTVKGGGPGPNVGRVSQKGLAGPARSAKGTATETARAPTYNLRSQAPGSSSNPNAQIPKTRGCPSLNFLQLVELSEDDGEDICIENEIIGNVNVVRDNIPFEFNEAVEKEIDRLVSYQFGEKIQHLPGDAEILECRMVLTQKDLADGSKKNKARLVVRGYQQTFEETLADVYSPVGKAESIRYLFSHAAVADWDMLQVDFDLAFIQSDKLAEDERVYVQIPMGLPSYLLERHGWTDGQVIRLWKPLYGMKQAPLFWYRTISQKMRDLGYSPMECDPCLWRDAESKLIVFIHVDDTILTSARGDGRKENAIKLLKSCFDLREDGIPKLFLGIEIEFGLSEVFVHQTRYTLKLLESFNKSEGRKYKVPINANVIESILNEAKNADPEFMKDYSYREFIGAGNWLAKGTRPDILFAISFLSRFQTCFGPSAVRAAQQVFGYLRNTLGYGIRYSKRSSNAFTSEIGEIIGFSDANWGENDLERKSTTGFCLGHAGGVISWASRKQKNIALSSTEAEIYALTDISKKSVELKDLVFEMNGRDDPLLIFGDNQSSIEVAHSAEWNTGRTKHISIRMLYVKQAIRGSIISLEWIETSENVADILTKPLGYRLFSKHRDAMGVTQGITLMAG